MKANDYAVAQQALAAAWKQRTATLPDSARQPAPWINQEGQPRGRYDFCLPASFAPLNLLPDVRAGAIALFTELGIPWHSGVDGGPGNHLLSSQVQCVNALYAMTYDPTRTKAAFGHLLDIDEVLEIEPGRCLTFEYIGLNDYFGEGAGKPRIRGSRCTSIDAAFKYRTTTGAIELALVEWKYTESYLNVRKPTDKKDQVRATRYLGDFEDAKGPIHPDLIDFALMLDEPFYQLMRQQLLAYRIESDPTEDASAVRVLHVLSPDNDAYQQSLVRPEHHSLGNTVDEVWARLLRTPERFLHVDPAVFLQEAVTCSDYVDRYGSLHG